MVKDGSGAPVYAFVEIVIKESPGGTHTTGSSKSTTDNYVWLWILILVIIIIIIISLLIVVTTKKKKHKLEDLGVPQEGEQVLQPDATYTPPPGISTAPSTTMPQPQLIEDRSIPVTPGQELITPTPPRGSLLLRLQHQHRNRLHNCRLRESQS